MIGNFLNKKMMGKMEEMQSQVEKIKERLSNISIMGQDDSGNVKVISDGNRVIKNIEITPNYFSTASEQEVKEGVRVATNRALKQAESIEKAEMGQVAMGLMPGV